MSSGLEANINPNGKLILIVEDEPGIAKVLEMYLRRDGFRTEVATNGNDALTVHRVARPELLLLDVSLPKMDGLEVLKQIRSEHDTPVILVTARAEDLDRLLGLSLGADDYIVKPFNPLEVVARVKAVLRRGGMVGSTSEKTLRVGSLEIDREATIARVNGQRLELTLSEFRLLEALAAKPNRTFSRSELLGIASPDSEALERVVDMHLSKVRHKLSAAGALERLETVRGLGYRLCTE
jgi:two-component system, OmpR family, response regulator AdeR